MGQNAAMWKSGSLEASRGFWQMIANLLQARASSSASSNSACCCHYALRLDSCHFALFWQIKLTRMRWPHGRLEEVIVAARAQRHLSAHLALPTYKNNEKICRLEHCLKQTFLKQHLPNPLRLALTTFRDPQFMAARQFCWKLRDLERARFVRICIWTTDLLPRPLLWTYR